MYFNRNQDGLIDREEFGDIMRATGEPLAEEDIDELMADADTNKDGKIDFDGKANLNYSIFMCYSLSIKIPKAVFCSDAIEEPFWIPQTSSQ